MVIVSRDPKGEYSELRVYGKDSKGYDIYEITEVRGRWVLSQEDWKRYQALKKKHSEY